MNGAESLIKTLVDSGVDVCFANPGTSEMHFVAALDEIKGMRCVLGLFEGVVSGAADGYARMARKPAVTLLHLGPGLGNALANIHNAKKGHVPMINIVGDHATYHLQYDAPLTSDIEGIARPVSHWVHTSTAAEEIAEDGARAVQAAGRKYVATLILPADVSWGDNPTGVGPVTEIPPLRYVLGENIESAVVMLRSGKPAMILVGGDISLELGLALSSLGVKCGSRICVETFPTRIRRGVGSAKLEKLPYLAEQAIEYMQDVENLILIGAQSPVSFFAYPNVPSVITASDCNILSLASPEDDLLLCVQELLVALGGEAAMPQCYSYAIPELPSGDLTAHSLALSIAHLLPENAVVIDEGVTTSLGCYTATSTSAPHDWLSLTGGSIGYGLPCAVGASIACPDRKVICMEGDGSAMYTLQALWTMARYNLDITVVIFNNHKYNVLELEFARTGARSGSPGPIASTLLDIGNPVVNFVAIAEGMGVRAAQVVSAEEFNLEFAAAIAGRGPHLIEAMVPPVRF